MSNDFLRATPAGAVLALKVQPRASQTEIGQVEGAELKVKVTAPPVDSAANEAVLRLLSETLGCPRSALELLRGRTSRHKQILVRGLSPDLVKQRLKLE